MEIKQIIRERAYAKINLHLDVTGKMDNGYHSVSTVMQTVSVFDVITINDLRITSGEPCFTVSCGTDGVPCDGRNLACRAAMLFCERAGVSLSGEIHIDKNIPMAAGMAGGSADGAAVLRGLNRALGYPFSQSELLSIGAELGSDVPFCIVGGTRYADGRGELLSEFPSMPDCFIVAGCEGEDVSTPWAYRLLDGIYCDFAPDVYSPVSVEPLLSAVESGDICKVAGAMYNIFESPVLDRRPVASELKRLLLEVGAIGAMMSGSGPSVFGVFADRDAAERAMAALFDRGFRGYLCRPCEIESD